MLLRSQFPTHAITSQFHMQISSLKRKCWSRKLSKSGSMRFFFFFFLSFSLNRKTDASQAYRKVGTFISSILWTHKHLCLHLALYGLSISTKRLPHTLSNFEKERVFQSIAWWRSTKNSGQRGRIWFSESNRMSWKIPKSRICLCRFYFLNSRVLKWLPRGQEKETEIAALCCPQWAAPCTRHKQSLLPRLGRAQF